MPLTAPRALTCGECFEILTDPVALPCGHAFDLRCVRARLERFGDGNVTCPLCNTPCPTVTLAALPSLLDAALGEALARFVSGEEPPPPCQWCEEQTAEVLCSECQLALCSGCNEAVHRSKAKRDHAPAALADARAAARAPRHCREPRHNECAMEFFCTQCSVLCCAYCLQIGAHKGHAAGKAADAAAAVRQQLGRQLDALGQVKAQADTAGSELNRVHAAFLRSYDDAESQIAERFRAMHEQLDHKEVEVRRRLQHLRDAGDASLAEVRTAALRQLDSVHEGGVALRRLQHGASDGEVLEYRGGGAPEAASLAPPPISGTGLRLSPPGEVRLTGLDLDLDLVVAQPARPIAGRSSLPVSRAGSEVGSAKAAARTRFRFEAEDGLDVLEAPEGQRLACHAAAAEQVGVRARESMESLRGFWEADGGVAVWRVRLDQVHDSFCGVLDTDTTQEIQDGFHWRPCHRGDYEGGIGTPTAVMQRLDPCRPGDVLTFSFDVRAQSLSLAINGRSVGPILLDVPLRVAPCFVFAPGETLTVLR